MSDRPVISPGDIEEEPDPGFSILAEPLEVLRVEGGNLHSESGAHGPFQRPEWHETWLRHFRGGPQPVFLAVRRGESLIGIAALGMTAGAARELGDPNIRDYGGPLAAEGYENDVALALLDWVAEDMTPELTLWGMRQADPLVRLFQAEAADNGWDLVIEDEAVAPAVALPADWEGYVASLSKHDRHELRRKLRNLEAAGEVRFESTGDATEIEASLGTLFAFMRHSHEGKDTFLTPEMEAFFRDLAATFAPLGLMRLGTLRFDGQPVAMLFMFETETGVYLYNSGYDPAFSHQAAGLLSKAYALREAIERGNRRFDFRRGDEEYKRRLGGVPETVVRLEFRRR